MIKNRLEKLIESAFQKASSDGAFVAFDNCPEPIVIEIPKLEEHGDLACGVALKLARHLKTAPLKIAETLSEYIEKEACSNGSRPFTQEVKNPGFINFRLGKEWLCQSLSEIHQENENFGKPEKIDIKKINVEYVSANPTGDLHIGHGRGAVLGSCLANLFRFYGHQVTEEFLVNDAGEQIAKLSECSFANYQRKLGKEVSYPEDGYPEESLASYVDEVIAEHEDRFLSVSIEQGVTAVGDLVKEKIRKHQEELLKKLGVSFDLWFSELDLHRNKKVEQALSLFEKGNYTFEKEGALWLKAEELGDKRDRVLRKSTGRYTYLAGDAAYHLDKYERGYDLMINIWGADHHGQVPGLKATIKALGEDPDKFAVILTQIVNLSRDGEFVRMSKRAGNFVTLEEVMDEVGVDAVRYYLAESNPQNPINFDLALAKETSKKNRAYYIQYAHARCCSILRNALEPYKNPNTKETEKPPLTEDELKNLTSKFQQDPTIFMPAFDDDPEIFNYQKKLVLRLQEFPQEVHEAANSWEPGKIARYGNDLANDLQKFYEESRVITSDLSVTQARLGLIKATQLVLKNALKIIGVSAPERM